MPRVKREQKSAVDIIDMLLFDQILFYLKFTDEEMDLIFDINELVDNKIHCSEVQFSGDRNILKHYIICLLELYCYYEFHRLSADFFSSLNDFPLPPEIDNKCYEAVHKYECDLAIGVLLGTCSLKYGENYSEAAQKVAGLLIEVVKEYPKRIQCRLVNLLVAFNYPFAPLSFFCEMRVLNILNSNKFNQDIGDKFISDSNEFLTRVLLLAEFRSFKKGVLKSFVFNEIKEELKNNLVESLVISSSGVSLYDKLMLEQVCKKSIKKYFDGYSKKVDLYAGGCITSFLSELNMHHIRMYTGTEGGIVGTLSVYVLDFLIKNHPFDSGRKPAIYIEESYNDADTIVDMVVKFMCRHGLKISRRTVYNIHCKHKNNNLEKISEFNIFYNIVNSYYFIIDTLPCNFISDFIAYDKSVLQMTTNSAFKTKAL